jgi:class 3 adenylate cyclase
MNEELLLQRMNKIKKLKPSLMAGIDELYEWIIQAPPHIRHRINPFLVQSQTSLGLKKILATLLAGTQTGAFQIHWDSYSPYSNKLTNVFHSLAEMKSKALCTTSGKEYEIDFLEHVKVSFCLNPEIELPSNLQEPEPEEIYLTGLDVIHVPEFREFFEFDCLKSTETLNISSVVVLYTNICNSTQIYEGLGNKLSYELVQENLKILKESIETEGGMVMKTISDSILASFLRSSSAINSIFKAKEKLEKFNSSKDFREQVYIKFGVHIGPVLLVNANNKLDYFGTTVNQVFKIQTLADRENFAFSEQVLHQEEVIDILKSHGIKRLKRKQKIIKSINGNFPVYLASY